MATARGGLDLATRMGVGDMALQLAEVVCAVAIDTGDWDAALAVIDEMRDRPQAPAHRIQFACTEATLRALRGDSRAGALLDGLEPLDPDTDPQIRAGIDQARAWIAFVDGRLEDARRLAEAAGTWSVTFTNDTDFVLTGPGGTNVAATIPAAYLTTPYTGVSIFLSATANNDLNYGSYADVTTFDVTGVGTPIHENFVTQGGISSPFLLLQDQTYGFVPTNNAPNMLFITSNDWNWFTWNLPDAQFQPEVRAGLTTNTPWVDSPLTNVNLFGKTRYTLVKKAYQQASSQQYFGLIKRGFSQLQVLLPGETNAPGTPSGKTGTPTPLDFNASLGLITYTVNACSSDWHIIPGVFDTITNSTTDTSASLPGTNPSLNNGINSTIQIVFSQTGTFTITASDVSNTNILSNTSSSVTVQ